MLLRRFLLYCLLLSGGSCIAQNSPDSALIDTTFYDYEELFSELDALLDSIEGPRSFAVISVGVAKSYLDYSSSNDKTVTKRQFNYLPSLGYYHKTGFGVNAAASVVNDDTGLNPYQLSLTGSYDYLQTKKLITGISFTHYLTKEGLPFYTSPLQNELYGYFTLRKLWFRPSIGASYGWGTRQEYQERENLLQKIKLTKKGFRRVTTTENIADFSLMTSVRHDFYFLHLLTSTDYFRLTPQFTFTSGTQQFGFNTVTNTFASNKRNARSLAVTSESTNYDDQLYFQPLSLAGQVRTEYVIGKFFVQPQFMVDYYFPAATNNITTSFFINAGVVF